MKFLLAVLMILVMQSDLVLRDVFEDCDIAVNQIESVQLFSRQDSLLLDTEESIGDFLNTRVIDTLQLTEFDVYLVPKGTYLQFVGVVEVDSLPVELWSSFGILVNQKHPRYWILLFRNNVTVRDVEGDVCGMYEISLDS